MNFKYFQRLISNTEFDEIKVIGKDVKKDEQNYHIIGMTLKDKNAVLYVLEAPDYLMDRSDLEEEGPIFPEERTHRNSLKDSMERDRHRSFFLRIREFQNDDNSYGTAGAQSGALMQNDYFEAFMLFMKMNQAGWKLSEDSPFYDIPWDFLAVTNIELCDGFDSLPEWEEDMEILYDSISETYPIEKPVFLECGKTIDIEFSLEDGSTAICYINKIELIDIWASQEKRFADPDYRERMLLHMSEDELEKMKMDLYKILEEHCPRGKCFMAIEYECSDEKIGLQFYDKEYLDTVPQPSSGSCSSLMMRNKPDIENGSHGLKLRGEIIQKPLDKDAQMLEAELFAYYKMVEKKSCKLSELIYVPLPKHVITEEEKEAVVAKYNLIKPKRK